MIKNKVQAIISDTSPNLNDLQLDFDPKEPLKVRAKMGDKEAVFDWKELYSFVFVTGGVEYQSELIPVKHTTITKYIVPLEVTLTKDLKAGQKVNVNYEVDIPKIIESGMKEEIRKKNKIIR
jgi:hypothetical protein